MCHHLEYRVEILGPIASETTEGVAGVLTRIGSEGWRLEASHLMMITGPRSAIQVAGPPKAGMPGMGLYCVFSRPVQATCQEQRAGGEL